MSYKYGLLKYNTNNVGDEIQSIATKQLLPRVDTYLDRDNLNKVKSRKKIKAIMNGWFTHNPENWPPSSDIEPLFVSFHITKSASDKLTSPRSIKYFKKHEPIGCRDYYTLNLLKDKGVNAYFSGCLTLTLEKRSLKESKEKLIVDVDQNILNRTTLNLNNFKILTHLLYPKTANKVIFSSKEKMPIFYRMLKKCNLTKGTKKYLRKMFDKYYQQTKLKKNSWNEAEKILKRYSEAELVLTSRLHCALPCIAFGTPVIFINDNLEDDRFGGLIKYLHAYHPEDFINKFNEIEWKNTINYPDDLNNRIEELKNRCQKFINN